jgi:hypothetical protein
VIFFVLCIIQPQTGFVSLSDVVPALTIHEYKDYLIAGWARPELRNSFTSIGVVYKRKPFRRIIQLQRIEGDLFGTNNQAEQHGVQLCKEWVDSKIGLTAIITGIK